MSTKNVSAHIALRNAGQSDLADAFDRLDQAIADAEARARRNATLTPIQRRAEVSRLQADLADRLLGRLADRAATLEEQAQPYRQRRASLAKSQDRTDLAARLQIAEQLQGLTKSDIYALAREDEDIAAAIASPVAQRKLGLDAETVSTILDQHATSADPELAGQVEQALRAVSLAADAAVRLKGAAVKELQTLGVD